MKPTVRWVLIVIVVGTLLTAAFFAVGGEKAVALWFAGVALIVAVPSAVAALTTSAGDDRLDTPKQKRTALLTMWIAIIVVTLVTAGFLIWRPGGHSGAHGGGPSTPATSAAPQASASASPSAQPNQVAIGPIVYDAAGSEVAVYTDPSGHIIQLIAEGTGWSRMDVTSAARPLPPAAGSGLAAYAVPQTGSQHILYLAVGHVIEFLSAGGRWLGPQ